MRNSPRMPNAPATRPTRISRSPVTAVRSQNPLSPAEAGAQAFYRRGRAVQKRPGSPLSRGRAGVGSPLAPSSALGLLGRLARLVLGALGPDFFSLRDRLGFGRGLFRRFLGRGLLSRRERILARLGGGFLRGFLGR